MTAGGWGERGGHKAIPTGGISPSTSGRGRSSKRTAGEDGENGGPSSVILRYNRTSDTVSEVAQGLSILHPAVRVVFVSAALFEGVRDLLYERSGLDAPDVERGRALRGSLRVHARERLQAAK